MVHTNSFVSLEGPLAAWLAGVPHVWHIRETFTINNPRFQPVIGEKVVRWFCQRITKATGGQLLCISQAVRNQFNCNDDLASVIYNPFCMPDHETLEQKITTQPNRSQGSRW